MTIQIAATTHPADCRTSHSLDVKAVIVCGVSLSLFQSRRRAMMPRYGSSDTAQSRPDRTERRERLPHTSGQPHGHRADDRRSNQNDILVHGLRGRDGNTRHENEVSKRPALRGFPRKDDEHQDERGADAPRPHRGSPADDFGIDGDEGQAEKRHALAQPAKHEPDGRHETQPAQSAKHPQGRIRRSPACGNPTPQHDGPERRKRFEFQQTRLV